MLSREYRVLSIEENKENQKCILHNEHLLTKQKEKVRTKKLNYT